jgi:hypothetical protein
MNPECQGQLFAAVSIRRKCLWALELGVLGFLWICRKSFGSKGLGGVRPAPLDVSRLIPRTYVKESVQIACH